MAHTPSYLQQHPNGTYYYRQVVPKRLRDQFSALPKEIKVSFFTKSRVISIQNTNYYWVALNNAFQLLMHRLDHSMNNQITRIEEILNEEEVAVFNNLLKGRSFFEEKPITNLDSISPYERMSYLGHIDKARSNVELIRSIGLGNELNQLNSLEELSELHSNCKDLALDVKASDREERISQLRKQAGLAQKQPTNSSYQIIESKKVESPLISKLIEKFVTEKIAAQLWRAKTKKENEGILSAFIRFSGDIPIADIKSELIRDYKDSEKAFDREKFTPQTINKHLSRLSSFFDYCQMNSYIESNPVGKLRVPQTKRGSKSRETWTREHLEKLFSLAIYQKDFRKQFNHAYQYWLPLLGLCTGARMAEICQLDVSDVIKSDGIWCISINDEGDKSLKNLSSKRIVPIHKQLVRLGFLEFVEKQKNAGHNKLFPSVKPWQGSYSHYASKWFEKFLKQFGIKVDKVVFHSFRHTFSTLAKAAGVPENVAQDLMGHTNQSITYSLYGSHGDAVKQMKKHLDKIDFGIDFSKISKFSEHKF